MLGETIAVKKEKGRSVPARAPRNATVAPVRRNGKLLEGEAQAQTDVAAELVQIWLAVLAVDGDRKRTSSP